ncbi:MAG: type II toxin-antitoxin system VapC family toxin [Gemmatimonadetes bacterium]|nr:type II toxin-antitoxin system VapC family toxin [Gemmatimonadota bacterium]MCY3612181.1 type II toxin-antitoxin system VapC family toxin [Gemmatimonadota bacterium]MCY3678693.1 type II toxin-antitoxin system VapC family toxin [Gemmatimonadota bacterium]MYA42281.1 type II toxin-antitoxin system VapC family toxin [Gemmatimonadota bacterium]MYE92489.1 type II toxin-antitoxin system VapC family toxin [Gemmatimonadota bacterium]
MSYLLDTHCWLWLQTTPERLPAELLDILADRSVGLFLSAASAWELGVKHAAGRIELPESPGDYVREGMRRGGVRELSMSHSHALEAAALPPHHRDPVDRMLVAQARLERLTLVTADRVLAAYDVDLIRVVRAADSRRAASGVGSRRYRGSDGE